MWSSGDKKFMNQEESEKERLTRWEKGEKKDAFLE